MMGCECYGWGPASHCRDGKSWKLRVGEDPEEYQATPPGEACRCGDECCNTGRTCYDGSGMYDFMPEETRCRCVYNAST